MKWMGFAGNNEIVRERAKIAANTNLVHLLFILETLTNVNFADKYGRRERTAFLFEPKRVIVSFSIAKALGFLRA